jgi:hypothetical protein
LSITFEQPEKTRCCFLLNNKMKGFKYYLQIFLLLGFFVPQVANFQTSLTNRLNGRILLQVEEHGEAWYVSPVDWQRYYLGRPDDALELMRSQGLGITNFNLSRILVANMSGKPDSDSDGLSDPMETAIGTNPGAQDTDKDGFTDTEEIIDGFNPSGPGRLLISQSFANQYEGRIFLQVESRGEAWYVNPADTKRYYLGRPVDALSLMRALGLGISNADLSLIPAATLPPKEEIIKEPVEPILPPRVEGELNLSTIEFAVHERINQERIKFDLSPLDWNNELAAVAREHSEDLMEENEYITAFGAACDYPIIHHEGKDFGLYNTDRMQSRDLFYFGQSAENIALVSGTSIRVQIELEDPEGLVIDNCQSERAKFDSSFRNKMDAANDAEKAEVIEDEIAAREIAFSKVKTLPIIELSWHSEDQVAAKIVDGWMDSPGHKENILEEGFEEDGVGVAYVNGYIIASQNYIYRVECGFETGPCCEKSGYYPYCFVPLECQQGLCG